MAPRPGNPRPRLGRKQWEIAALEMIGERGVAGLAVEPLARRIGVTKGSFYWHFDNLEALMEAALARWERVFTDLKYGALEKISDPAERLRPLFGDLAAEEPAIQVFLALLEAREHPAVRPVLRRATQKRLRFLAETLGDLGMSPKRAQDRARLLFSAYAGFQQLATLNLEGLRSRRERKAFLERLFQRLVREG